MNNNCPTVSKRPVGRPRKPAVQFGESKHNFSSPKEVKGSTVSDDDDFCEVGKFIGYLEKNHMKPTFLEKVSRGQSSSKRSQGRATEPLPVTYPSRGEYRRRLRDMGRLEMTFQMNAALHDITSRASTSLVTISLGGVLDLGIDRIQCTLNDMVFMSKTPIIKYLNAAHFGVIRPCRSENCADRTVICNRRHRRFGNHRSDESKDDKKIKIMMIGGKVTQKMLGEWYIHSIVNLTTFERIYNALQRRGALPLESQLLGLEVPCPYVITNSSVPIRRELLTERQYEAILSVCGSLSQKGLHIIHGPPGTGKTRKSRRRGSWKRGHMRRVG